MLRRFLPFLSLLLLTLPCKAQDTPASQTSPAVTQSTQIARELVEKLLRHGGWEQGRALREIEAVQAQIPDALIAEFDTLKLLPDAEKRRIQGPFHMVLILMGNLRLKEAENRLMEIADFSINPATAPLGHWYGGISNYPAIRRLMRFQERVAKKPSGLFSPKYPNRAATNCALTPGF